MLFRSSDEGEDEEPGEGGRGNASNRLVWRREERDEREDGRREEGKEEELVMGAKGSRSTAPWVGVVGSKAAVGSTDFI